MENMIKALVAQGISQDMAESMVKSFKPKKEKTAKKYFPGMSTSTKVDKTITAKTYCQCCGNVMVQEITIKAVSKDSPDEQKLATSVCSQCPDFVRQFSHEELVTMILLGEKSAQELRNSSVKFRAMLAQKLTPETVITFTTLSNMDKEVK
jgi:hypothetical protein